MVSFPHLFSPFQLGSVTLKNRIFVPSHGTRHARNHQAGDDLIAYYEARARGGVGMIFTEVCSVHSSYDVPNRISLTRDEYVPGVRRLADMCHSHDCAIVVQLYHPGRIPSQSLDGSRLVAYAPSEVMDEQHRFQPYPMPADLILEIVESFAEAAHRASEAGCDGIEIIGSMGYLVAQFLNPRVNLRTDQYGGSPDGRLKFLRDIITAIRHRTPSDFLAGVRISADEMDHDGLRPDEVREICRALDQDGQIDFLDIIAGSAASAAGWTHVVPPMFVKPGYLADSARAIKGQVAVPVLVAGRINQPQHAEKMIEDGDADLCGMVRATICDPEFANKAREGRAEDIRACIGCNQACIGHGMGEFGISCIQHPESGREQLYGVRQPASPIREVLVVGGGPAGLKAAAVAAERGHRVILHERETRLGGQVLLAQSLPGRAEFGGIITNLHRECVLAGVTVQTGSPVTSESVELSSAEVVILATGAVQAETAIEGLEESHVIDAWSVISEDTRVGTSVIIADSRCDWIGLGVAEKLARSGCRVRLVVNGAVPGDGIHFVTRNMWIGALHQLGVEMIPFARLYGVDSDHAYFQHTINAEPIVFEGIDSVVTVSPNRRVATLADALAHSDREIRLIGDCLSPRTAEEAVLDGLRAGVEV